MYIILVSRCSNPLQWYSNNIGHRYLCSESKFGGYTTKILGSKLQILEKDTKIITTVKVQGKPYSQEAFLIDPKGVYSHNDLEGMLDMVNLNTCTNTHKLEHSEQISASSEVL